MTHEPKEAPEAFGPEYPVTLGKDVLNFRKLADKTGFAEFSLMTRRGYGNAVLAAIREKQKGELRRAAVPVGKPNCASGTFHQTGAAILKAVAAANRAMATAPGDWTGADQERADKTYAALMVAKRGALENVAWCKAA
jgi:hypothetical protein